VVVGEAGVADDGCPPGCVTELAKELHFLGVKVEIGEVADGGGDSDQQLFGLDECFLSRLRAGEDTDTAWSFARGGDNGAFEKDVVAELGEGSVVQLTVVEAVGDKEAFGESTEGGGAEVLHNVESWLREEVSESLAELGC